MFVRFDFRSIFYLTIRYRMSKARSFCFTINNYTDDDECYVNTMADMDNVKYMVVGVEKGDNGTPHYQGYVSFENARSFSAVKKELPRAHIEVAKGSAMQNRIYCIKEELYLEVGNIPKQGARSDIEQVKVDLAEGANMRAIVTTAKSCQSVRMAELWLKYHEQERDWIPNVKWFFGDTGTGKTRTAYKELKEYGDVYTTMHTIKWWEGYDAHENVIIDDFRDDFCTWKQLLNLTDSTPFKVECKNGSRQLLAKNIIFTSPYHPCHVFANITENVEQFIRRLTEIRHFK